jgi:hypothetical protein
MRDKQTVATFSDLDKAKAVSARLTGAGIPNEVKDESNLQRFWFLSKPLAGEKVIVEHEFFDRALVTLKEADAKDHILQGEVRCPQCGSAEIQYPQFTRKFIATTLAEILCLLHIIDREFYCADCHHTWPVSHVLRPKNDVLGWPAKDRGVVRHERG